MRTPANVSTARRLRLAVLAAVTLCSAMPAQPADAAPVDAANASCRAAIAKSVSKLANTTMKAFDGCIKAGLKGEAVDCSDHETADLKSKIDSAKAKLTDTIETKCNDTTHAVALSEMQTCGPPDGAALDQFADLPGCYNDMVPENIDALRSFILNPHFSTATGDIAKCIQAIAKNSTKVMKTVQKEKHKTIKSEDALGFDSNYLDPGDVSGKIGDTLFKALNGISTACEALSDIEWKAVSSCDNGDIDAPLCILQHVLQLADGITAAAYDLPGICPSIVDILFLDGAEDGVVKRATDLDVGWTGHGHQNDSSSYFFQSVDLDCGIATGNDCSSCAASVNCDGGNCRCRNDNFTFCDEPFVADVDDCAGNVCDVLLGPPLPAPAGGTPLCLVQRMESLGGTMSFTAGATELEVGVRSFLHIGATHSGPCPTCSELQTCVGGERDGLFCEPDALTDFGIASYDCPPEAVTNLTGVGIATDVVLSTVSSTLTAALPCDAPLAGSDCACSACSGDPTIACSTDTVCVNAGAGVCGTTQAEHGGEAREPNGCSDLTCTPIVGEPGEGECLADEDLWCNGIVKGNGDGVVACSSNADCVLVAAGECTQSLNRRCFLDPIAANGSGGPRTGVDDGVLSSAYCVPPSSNSALNTALGFPGPARMTLAAEFYAVCGDEFTLWSPGGAVCQ